MMIRTSKELSAFGDMHDAIERAMQKNNSAFDFLADIHDAGFMVVSADAVVVEPATSWLAAPPALPLVDPLDPIPWETPTPAPAAAPAMPLGPDGRPELDDTQPF